MTKVIDMKSIIENSIRKFEVLEDGEDPVHGKKSIPAKDIDKIVDHLDQNLSNNLLKERLAIIYEYEKKYLDLTKEYKEEIKFAANLQEDVRKERANFFSDVLKDVHQTLTEINMDSSVTDLWLSELVSTYTHSLNISAELAKDQILEVLSQLRTSAKKDLHTISGE